MSIEREIDRLWMDAIEYAAECGQSPHRVFAGRLLELYAPGWDDPAAGIEVQELEGAASAGD